MTAAGRETRGRPRGADAVRDVRVALRLTRAEYALAVERAHNADRKLSDWIRHTITRDVID